MLVLARRPDEEVQILNEQTGEEIIVSVCDLRPDKVKLGFGAPAHYRVMRTELLPQLDDSEPGQDGKPRGPFVETINRVPFDLMNPRSCDVYIEDVVWSLSQQCRWTGHTRELYTVAQHSVLCSRLFDDPELAYAALLHDAAETYFGDVSRPVKQALGAAWEALENRVAPVVAEAFGLQWPPPEEVQAADLALLHGEAIEQRGGPPADWTHDRPAPPRIGPCWEPGLARHLFMERYTLLTLMRAEIAPRAAEASLGPEDLPPRRDLAGAAEPALSVTGGD